MNRMTQMVKLMEPEFEVEKPESEVYVSPSSSVKIKKHDDKLRKRLKARVMQISTNSTNTFSDADPSNTAVSSTHGKYSYVDPSQYHDDPNMPDLEDITYSDDDEDVGVEVAFTNIETTITISSIPTTRVHKDHLVTQIISDLSLATQTKSITRMVKDQGGLTQINNEDFHTYMFACFLSQEEPKRVHQALKDLSWIEAMQDKILQFKMQKVWVLVDLPNGKRAIVARIESIRLFLAYASFMGFMVYQIDVKSAFLYGTIKEEVYVCQPPGFEDPDYPDNVYKVAKALYGLHQAPRAWSMLMTSFLVILIKTSSTPIDTKKPLPKDLDGEDVDVHTYRPMIGSLMYLTSSRPDIMFVVCACARFQVTPKVSHLHAVKRIFRYLKGKPHLDLWCPKDSPFNLVAYFDSDYAGASLDRKFTTGGYQFLGCKLISWQCKKKIVVATSSTEADLVRNVDSSLKFYMYPRFLQLMIRAQVGDVFTHTTKYLSYALTQTVFANMRMVGKGFSRVETPLFEGGCIQTRRIIEFMDANKDVTLKEVDVAKDAEVEKIADVKGRQKESQAKAYHIDLEHVDKVLITAAATTAASTITAAPSAARRRKGVVIRDPEETATPSTIIHSEPKSKDKEKGIMYFNSNVAFLKKSKEQLEEEESRALKRQSESSEEKAAKKHKLDEEVPVVDYEIHTEYNKPYYKIIRADGSHQLFLSFLSLLRNFDREDLEMLWQLVQDRFASSKPKNFSDDFLLTTLKAMFKKPDVEAQVWKNQRGVHGLVKVKSSRLLESCGVHIITFTTTQMILLVERRYLLTRFTLEQMLNNVRLEVEEESEVSLELLRFVRKQQQEGYRPE
uniref:Reverse transcriptase Ty1/copia-type domain-containing protein n=1 Tax=Tanacetum cinerariifolium TaxID=118510 RepID=A0A699H089_TANCI|nr:hypothetical protein [Tanacetum cinerariifolium]